MPVVLGGRDLVGAHAGRCRPTALLYSRAVWIRRGPPHWDDGYMPLAIDSSRAFRRIQELVGLVDAVILADPNDESDWIEWKAGLILANKDSVVQLARHILGMANRKVSEAARFAEGCGYHRRRRTRKLRWHNRDRSSRSRFQDRHLYRGRRA